MDGVRKENHMSTQHPTPNDDRSQKKNPEHPQFESDRINREKQQQEQQKSGGNDPKGPQPSTPKK